MNQVLKRSIDGEVGEFQTVVFAQCDFYWRDVMDVCGFAGQGQNGVLFRVKSARMLRRPVFMLSLHLNFLSIQALAYLSGQALGLGDEAGDLRSIFIGENVVESLGIWFEPSTMYEHIGRS